MSRWKFKYLGTDTTGKIVAETNIVEVKNKFRIEKTVGDEFFVKTGDIFFETWKKIELSAVATSHWIAVYFNESIFDVFSLERDFDVQDQKFNLFQSRLNSIQKKVLDDFKKTTMQSESNSNYWGWKAPQGNVNITQIKYADFAGVPVTISNQHGFSLGDVLMNMSGDGGASNFYGYSIHSVLFPGPVKNQHNLPVLYRGRSWDFNTFSDDAAFDNTFKNYSMTWFDLMQLAIFAFNAFVDMKPVIYKSGVMISLVSI